MASPAQGNMLLRSMLSDLRESSRADIAVFFSVRTTGSKVYYRGVHAVADPREDARLVEELLEGKPLLDFSFGSEESAANSMRRGGWTIRRPLARHYNRFTQISEDYEVEEIKDTAVWKESYRLLDVGAQARALVYHGGWFVGWLSVWRRGETERFTQAELEAINARPWIQRTIALAAVEPASGWRDRAHAFVSRARGLEWVSGELRQWLSSERLEQIDLLVQGLDSTGDGTGWARIDGVIVTATRMQAGKGDGGYILAFEPLKPIAVHPTAGLTEVEIQVLDAITAGLSNADIADVLGCGVSEVRGHVARLYTYYGVSSRVDLACVVREREALAR